MPTFLPDQQLTAATVSSPDIVFIVAMGGEQPATFRFSMRGSYDAIYGMLTIAIANSPEENEI